MIDSPSNKSMGITLDSAPPHPGGSPVAPPSDSGMGEMARSPQLMTMQGMAMVKDGFQLLANGIPALAQILNNSITDLEQMVVQAMSQTMGAGPQAAPPGVAPMMPPPPGGPPPGGPSGMPQMQ